MINQLNKKGLIEKLDIWIKTDIEKRDCVINNNLNYIVLWNKNQINRFFEMYYKGEAFKGFYDFNNLSK